MRYTIRSDSLQVTADTRGAEMRSIRGIDGTEFICPDDRRNWNGCAPVLFPNTGAVKDQFAIVGDKRYPFQQHGFAKDSEFTLVQCSESEMTYELHWSDETLDRYPYRFALRVSYSLTGDTLTVKSTIENEDSKVMHASLGFHPGFACPFSTDENAEDYEIVFPQTMTASRVTLKNALVSGKIVKYWDGLSALPVQNGMFDGGSFTMTDLSSYCVKLLSTKSGKSITFDLDDYPNLVLWAPVGLPITNICIEPWYGIPDANDYDHRWETHPFTFQVSPNEKKEMVFRVTCR